jgi:hypothetical protein
MAALSNCVPVRPNPAPMTWMDTGASLPSGGASPPVGNPTRPPAEAHRWPFGHGMGADRVHRRQVRPEAGYRPGMLRRSNLGYIGLVVLFAGLVLMLFGLRPVKDRASGVPPQQVASITGQGLSVVGSGLIGVHWWLASRDKAQNRTPGDARPSNTVARDVDDTLT